MTAKTPTFQVSGNQFESLFPFHFQVDEKLSIISHGESLGKLLMQSVIGTSIGDHFTLRVPTGELSYQRFVECQDRLTILSAHARSIPMRGQVLVMEQSRTLLFLLTPWLMQGEDLDRSGLTAADFAVHDASYNLCDLMRSQRMIMQQFAAASAQAAKQAEDLRVARHEMEKGKRDRGLFLANLGHELKTPLNAILGFTQILQRDSSLDDGQQESLATVHQSGDHLLGILDGFLDMAKLDSGEVKVKNVATNVPVLLEGLVVMLGSRAHEKGLGIKVSVDSDVPSTLIVDRAKLGQVLINLINNAIKFSKHGEISVSVGLEDESLVCKVQDTGIGIPAEDLKVIFEPFERGADRDSFEGTGLGLAIATRFLDVMGGSIDASSEVGVGSCFVVRVPLIEGDRDLKAGDECRSEAEDTHATPFEEAPVGLEREWAKRMLRATEGLNFEVVESLINELSVTGVGHVWYREFQKLAVDFRYDEINALVRKHQLNIL